MNVKLNYRVPATLALSWLTLMHGVACVAESYKSRDGFNYLSGRLIFNESEITSINASLSDVMDLGVSGDEFNAQQIGGAVVGVVSQASPWDVFRVTMKAGDVIALDQAAISTNSDLDIFAQSVDGRYLAISALAGQLKCVRASHPGDYLLRVLAVSGAARYRLRKMPATEALKCSNETALVPKSGDNLTQAASGLDGVIGAPVNVGYPAATAQDVASKKDAFAQLELDVVEQSSGGGPGAHPRKVPVIAVIDGGFDARRFSGGNISTQAFGVSAFDSAHARASALGSHGSDMIEVMQGVISKAFGDINASYMALEVYGSSGLASMKSVAQAILYASRIPNATGNLPPMRADVINISMGAADRCIPEMQEAIALARAQGVVVVAAAGNEADNDAGQALPIDSPASCQGVISVGSVNSAGEPSRFSHSGPQLSLVAPGGDMTVDAQDGARRCLDPGWLPPELASIVSEEHCGSSVSTAFVSAVIASMKARHADLTPDNIDVLTRAGALSHQMPRKGHDDLMGYGLVSMRAAMNAVRLVGERAEPAAVAPKGVLLDELRQQGWIRVRKSSGDRLLAVRTTSPAFSLKCKTGDVDDDAWLCRVTFNAKGMRSGLHYADAEITTLKGAHHVPVRAFLRGGNGIQLKNFGPAMVWVVDVATNTVVNSLTVSPSSQGYIWSVRRRRMGNFYVIAGVDIDGNGRLCDELEPCGAYLAANGSLRAIDPSGGRSSAIDIRMQSSGLSVVRAYAGALHPQSKLSD
jgi:hypothetical protein